MARSTLEVKTDNVKNEVNSNMKSQISEIAEIELSEIKGMVNDLQNLYNRMGRVYNQALTKRKQVLKEEGLLKSVRNEDSKSINTKVLQEVYRKQKLNNSKIQFSQKFKELAIEAYEKVQILRQIFTGEKLKYLIGIEDSKTGNLYVKEIDFKEIMGSIVVESEIGNTIAKLRVSSTAITNNMMKQEAGKLVIDPDKVINMTSDAKALQRWKDAKSMASNNGIAFEIFTSQNLGLTYQLQNNKWFEGGDIGKLQLKFFGTLDNKIQTDLTDFSTCINAIGDLLNIFKNYNSQTSPEQIKDFFKAETLDKESVIEGHVTQKVQEEYDKLITDFQKELKNLKKG